MMYRPNFARSVAHFARNSVARIATDFKNATSDAVLAVLVQSGILAQAERENRRRNRHMKRAHRFTSYQTCGLNGKRAVARRLRQIAAVSLRVENGLVRS